MDGQEFKIFINENAENFPELLKLVEPAGFRIASAEDAARWHLKNKYPFFISKILLFTCLEMIYFLLLNTILF